MMKIMRTLGITVISVLLLGVGVLVPVAAQEEVPVSINAPDRVVPGSDFTATVDLGAVVDLNAAQYDISFDPLILRLDDITAGQIDSTEMPVLGFTEIGDGTYLVLQSLMLETVSGSGYLAELHFHALARGESDIDLSNGLLSGMEAEIPATWTGDSVVVNTPPVLSDGGISQETGYVTTEFTYSVTYTDADNDPPASPTVSIDGTPHEMTAQDPDDIDYTDGRVYEYPTSGLAKDIDHTYQFAATDGVDDATGDTGVHSGPTIQNSPPNTPVVDVTPDSPLTTDDLVCTITTPSPDPDGDEVTYSYEWYKDDVLQTGLTSNTVPSANTSKGEVWKCVVTPNDGIVDGPTGQDQVTIENNPPTAPVIDVTPDVPLTSDNLVCSITTPSTDPDGDTVTYSYAWYKDDVLQEGLTANTVDSTNTLKGEVWKCVVTPNDGTVDGPASQDQVTIANTPPLLSDGGISQETGYVTTEFTYSVTYTDADNDPPASPTVSIDGTPHEMTAQDPDDIDYTDGRVYEYPTRGLAKDIDHTYQFAATDGVDDATGDTGVHSGPTIQNSPPNTPASPLCEGVTSPTEVKDPTPEFSWTFSDPDAGDTQGAYQILVASTSETLALDIGDMWDSGKVSSSADEVSYEGTILTENETYYWKVKTWDNDDAEGPYCDEQQFTMATCPSEVWVDDDWEGTTLGDLVDDHTFGYDAFAIIQEGIDAVTGGGTVNVAEGIYSENVLVDKSLAIQAASSAIIDGTDLEGSGVAINASGVVFSGFTVQNFTYSYGIATLSQEPGSTNENTIADNEVTGNAVGIYLDQYSHSNIISGNSINGNGHGILIDGDDNQILGNDIRNNSASLDSGIHLTSRASGNVIHFNNIVGNSPEDSGSYGLYNENTEEEVNAENNWWGDASGPSGVGPGTGDGVSDYVDYEPWIRAGVEDSKSEKTEAGDYTVDAKEKTNTDVLKKGDGTPTITVTKYTDNPGGSAPSGFTSVGKYIDVHIDDMTDVEEIEIRNYYTQADIAGLNEATLKLSWWNGTEWIECSDSGATYPAGGPTYRGYTWAKIRTDTTPLLDDLAGAPFMPIGRPTVAPAGGGGGGGGAPPTITTVSISGLTTTTDLRVDRSGIVQEACCLKCLDEKAFLDIARGIKVLDAEGKALESLSASRVTSPPAPPTQSAIACAYDFGPAGVTFEPPMTLTMSYDPESFPEGMVEDELYIAYWDGSKWLALESTVDTEANTVSADISHFTQFAVIAKLPPPPPAPARFTISSFSVSPSRVEPAEQVTTSAMVTNTGGSDGKYTVVLKINGVEEARKEVTLDAGASQKVSFSIVKRVAGTYEVDINGLVGSFAVKEKPAPVPPPAPGPNWWLVSGVIAGCVVAASLIYFLFIKRRREA